MRGQSRRAGFREKLDIIVVSVIEHQRIGMEAPARIVEFGDAAAVVSMGDETAQRDAMGQASQRRSFRRDGRGVLDGGADGVVVLLVAEPGPELAEPARKAAAACPALAIHLEE